MYQKLTWFAIADPDRSNPTRSRWERPLDTIRSFEAAIDGNYSRKSYMRTGQIAVTLLRRALLMICRVCGCNFNNGPSDKLLWRYVGIHSFSHVPRIAHYERGCSKFGMCLKSAATALHPQPVIVIISKLSNEEALCRSLRRECS